MNVYDLVYNHSIEDIENILTNDKCKMYYSPFHHDYSFDKTDDTYILIETIFNIFEIKLRYTLFCHFNNAYNHEYDKVKDTFDNIVLNMIYKTWSKFYSQLIIPFHSLELYEYHIKGE